MATRDTRITTYLGAFFSDWITGMCGPLSVPFAALAIWSTQSTQKTLWGCLAVSSFFVASFRVWRNERLHGEGQLAELNSTVEEKNAQIAERDGIIRTFQEKPKRTAAEQHHYETAKKALEELGPNARIALCHLKIHGELTFGTYNPVLPAGWGGDQLRGMYISLAVRGLVSQKAGKRGSGEMTFDISPTMNGVLDELLYHPEGE